VSCRLPPVRHNISYYFLNIIGVCMRTSTAKFTERYGPHLHRLLRSFLSKTPCETCFPNFWIEYNAISFIIMFCECFSIFSCQPFSRCPFWIIITKARWLIPAPFVVLCCLLPVSVREEWCKSPTSEPLWRLCCPDERRAARWGEEKSVNTERDITRGVIPQWPQKIYNRKHTERYCCCSEDC